MGERDLEETARTAAVEIARALADSQEAEEELVELTMRVILKHFTPDKCSTEGHVWKQWATHLNCERCNESIEIDCP